MFFYSVEAMKKCDDILNSIDKTLTFLIEEIGKIKK